MAEGGDDDQADKTEEASAKKLREAREKGQLALSKEVNSWVMLFVGFMIMVMLSGWLLSRLQEVLRIFVALPHQMMMGSRFLREVTWDVGQAVLLIILVPMGLLMLAGILAAMGQAGLQISWEPLKPKWSKISPLKGFKRVFGIRSVVELLKGVAKLIVVGIVTYFIIEPLISGEVQALLQQDILGMLAILRQLLIRLFIAILAVMFVVTVLDYIYQRYSFMEQMKMSKREVKEEYKQSEGDPQIKARLRKLRAERSKKRMMTEVPNATVVITNPTHFSVALKYETATMNAPVVIAKGQDFIALKIREIATENDVPIVENPPLARTLFATVDIDDEVPEEHYKAVAKVVSYVFSLKKRK